MIEFSNWWKYYCAKLRKTGLEYHVLQPDGAAKMAWRAALKWAKAMHGVSSEPRFNLNITKELDED